MSAEYAIAQYHRNPLRREPRNIGIIVAISDSRAARFAGEIADTGEIDGRSTKWAAHPNVYRKWVKYWREQLTKPGDDLLRHLMQTNGDNYDVVRGGVVTDYGQDSVQIICDNLFSLLVDPEQFAPALADREEAEWEISRRTGRTGARRVSEPWNYVRGRTLCPRCGIRCYTIRLCPASAFRTSRSSISKTADHT